MNELAQLQHDQQALLGALLGGRNSSALTACWQAGSPAQEKLARRGLQAYLANGDAVAERVLAAAYPVLLQLMDTDNFAPMASHYWRAHPPHRGDMACWGGGLADFIQAAPQLAGEPFLADVARVEWARHAAATAADAECDAASFGLLVSGEPAPLTLGLAPGFALVDSAWPVVSILNAHLVGHPTLHDAGIRLRDGVAECALVWRQGLRPRLRGCSAGEQALLYGLAARQPLEVVLAGLEAQGLALDFAGWLATAVQSGLVIRAVALE